VFFIDSPVLAAIDLLFFLHFPVFTVIIFLMPTETRLLYLLSDLAYIAKLIPGKKAHEFSISDFHQVNGQFLDENQLLANNIEKLFEKLESGVYHLILPDFLFTNTIINLQVESEEEVKEHLKNKFLPELKISSEDYYLSTTILSNYNGVYKVQLTALEKGIVSPLVKALTKKEAIKISTIAPLSFAAKSLISLEPSVAILQLGRELFLAEHYIGLDQCFSTTIDEAADFAETVKTLKGVEPSLQTVYLLSDALVDDKIKTALKETLPVQQLADIIAGDEKIPSHLKIIIEAAAKTLSIPEYLLPQFSLDEKYDKELDLGNKDEQASDDLEENLVKPAVIGQEKKTEVESETEPEPETETEIAPEPEQTEKEVPVVKDAKPATLVGKAEDNEVLPEPSKLDLNKVNETIKPAAPKEIDLAQFANLAVDPSVINKKIPISNKQANQHDAVMSEPKAVIKNQSEAGGMMKMIGIALLSFIVTIALGIGIGLGYLQLSNRQIAQPTTTVDQTEEVEVEASPSPTPEPVVINKDEYALLVVNATAKAGYAGQIANKLTAADFSQVTAGNAKGTYEDKNYLLLASLDPDREASNQALLLEVEAATGLIFELSDKISIEDNTSKYQAVVVLGE